MPTDRINSQYDEHGNEKPRPTPSAKFDAERPGYEITDVNTKGVVVFLAGLMGFLVIFFVLCFAMGKAINFGILKQDGDEARFSSMKPAGGGAPAGGQRRGENLASSAELEQKQANLMAQTFPTPRLDADDSNQQTADIHAREDLLLEHTTAVEPGQGERVGAVRIPIERAMALIVERGLPASNGIQGVTDPGKSPQMQFAGDVHYEITKPLTNGFARTAYELDQMESREQQVRLAHEGNAPAANTHAKLEKQK